MSSARLARGATDVDEGDSNAGFLRAARDGNFDDVVHFLRGGIDINTSNPNGLNALHLATKEGHIRIVTELIRRGANVEAATKKGNTALHIASLAGHDEIVKKLVDNGAQVNLQAQAGFTPLYMASQEGHADVVKFLLSHGANQGLSTEDGFTPLAVALQQGHDKVVTVLLEHDAKGKVRLPALHIAAKKDDVKSAALLLQNEQNSVELQTKGGLVNDTTKSGFTPLHIAAHYGNMNVANLLIQRNADVNFRAKNNITPLHVASRWGKLNMVNLLIDSNANIDEKTRDGLTPLHCAARSGHDSVVDTLLERGAPNSAKTKNGLTPLHMAAQGDHEDCARLLLYHKALINEVTVDYLTPLHVAAHCGNVKTAKLLLDRKCEPNARALNGFTPLHIACKKNRIKIVELLLKYGASIESKTESGLTPLHVASFMGHMNIVIYLIQHNANPNTTTVRGETSLHLAARANQTDIIRILLRNGATVDARAREQQTPLHIASRLGNVDNVVLLLQHGAVVDAATKDKYTPLHIAAKEGHEEVAQVLLEQEAQHDVTTKKGFTPLHIAAKYGNIKVARLLLQKEANPNVQGKNGLTPLHVATHYNHANLAQLLLENKANPHATAKNGYTPLHIAAKKNQMDIATTLLEYGAKPNAESKNGFTPLHLASQEGHTDIVSLLLEKDANVNCKAHNGLTPMHLAAQEDHVAVAEILCKYNSEIDTSTKAGYTPLHTACHFGQVNMVRFLLGRKASVNTTTKVGYTPLHQAAQQGHVQVVSLLLKNQASPNAVTNNGQTPLAIAQKLGYISVVEILKPVTDVQAVTPATEDKYKVVSPETMQETFISDSEDEGGSSNAGSVMLLYGSLTTSSAFGDDYLPQSPIFDKPKSDHHFYVSYSDGQKANQRDDSMSLERGGSTSPLNMSFDKDYMDAQITSQSYQTMFNAAPVKNGRLPVVTDTHRYSSYSGSSFSTSFDPDNVAVDRSPVCSGFLISFMVDARGGAMRGCRHPGVRIIIPPRKCCMPTRITCRLIKREKLIKPPPMLEGEGLAARVLEMGPVGTKFLGPVLLEVPHFASLRGKEREVVILRSDNGETWYEHPMVATEDAVTEALGSGSVVGGMRGSQASVSSLWQLDSDEELSKKRIKRVLTTDLPQYFALVSRVTRVKQESIVIGMEGGVLSSNVVPQVQAVLPEGTLTRPIPVGLQAQPIAPELVAKLLGNRVAVSPIVTIEPRRRKFHKPITLTIPVPRAAQKGMINQYGGDRPTLRLLFSLAADPNPAAWEDVTDSKLMTLVDDCVSFTTTVSARFWLIDCQNVAEASQMASILYQEAVTVPYMAKFVVFAKRDSVEEGKLRIFCMTDDKDDKTLEKQERFFEVARSRDIEVLDGRPQFVEMAGNLIPVTKSGDQLHVNFRAFRENRLPCTVKVRDQEQEASARVAFMKEPKVARGEAPQTPICNLNIRLPDLVPMDSSIESDKASEILKRHDFLRGQGLVIQDTVHRAEMKLTDVADALQGDWVALAQQLNISMSDVNHIKNDYKTVGDQALAMLHLWVQKNPNRATDNQLETALRKINRDDIIKKCMHNTVLVEDQWEEAAARVAMDQSGFETLREELGVMSDSIHRGPSLDVQYDEHEIIQEAAADDGPGSKRENVIYDVRSRVIESSVDGQLTTSVERDDRFGEFEHVQTPPPSPTDNSDTEEPVLTTDIISKAATRFTTSSDDDYYHSGSRDAKDLQHETERGVKYSRAEVVSQKVLQTSQVSGFVSSEPSSQIVSPLSDPGHSYTDEPASVPEPSLPEGFRADELAYEKGDEDFEDEKSKFEDIRDDSYYSHSTKPGDLSSDADVYRTADQTLEDKLDNSRYSDINSSKYYDIRSQEDNGDDFHEQTLKAEQEYPDSTVEHTRDEHGFHGDERQRATDVSLNYYSDEQVSADDIYRSLDDDQYEKFRLQEYQACELANARYEDRDVSQASEHVGSSVDYLGSPVDPTHHSSKDLQFESSRVVETSYYESVHTSESRSVTTTETRTASSPRQLRAELGDETFLDRREETVESQKHLLSDDEIPDRRRGVQGISHSTSGSLLYSTLRDESELVEDNFEAIQGKTEPGEVAVEKLEMKMTEEVESSRETLDSSAGSQTEKIIKHEEKDDVLVCTPHDGFHVETEQDLSHEEEFETVCAEVQEDEITRFEANESIVSKEVQERSIYTDQEIYVDDKEIVEEIVQTTRMIENNMQSYGAIDVINADTKEDDRADASEDEHFSDSRESFDNERDGDTIKSRKKEDDHYLPVEELVYPSVSDLQVEEDTYLNLHEQMRSELFVATEREQIEKVNERDVKVGIEAINIYSEQVDSESSHESYSSQLETETHIQIQSEVEDESESQFNKSKHGETNMGFAAEETADITDKDEKLLLAGDYNKAVSEEIVVQDSQNRSDDGASETLSCMEVLTGVESSKTLFDVMSITDDQDYSQAQNDEGGIDFLQPEEETEIEHLETEQELQEGNKVNILKVESNKEIENQHLQMFSQDEDIIEEDIHKEGKEEDEKKHILLGEIDNISIEQSEDLQEEVKNVDEHEIKRFSHEVTDEDNVEFEIVDKEEYDDEIEPESGDVIVHTEDFPKYTERIDDTSYQEIPGKLYAVGAEPTFFSSTSGHTKKEEDIESDFDADLKDDSEIPQREFEEKTQAMLEESGRGVITSNEMQDSYYSEDEGVIAGSMELPEDWEMLDKDELTEAEILQASELVMKVEASATDEDVDVMDDEERDSTKSPTLDETQEMTKSTFSKMLDDTQQAITERESVFNQILDDMQEDIKERESTFSQIFDEMQQDIKERESTFSHILDEMQHGMTESTFDQFLDENQQDVNEREFTISQILDETQQDINETDSTLTIILDEMQQDIKETESKFNQILVEMQQDIKETGSTFNQILHETQQDIKQRESTFSKILLETIQDTKLDSEDTAAQEKEHSDKSDDDLDTHQITLVDYDVEKRHLEPVVHDNNRENMKLTNKDDGDEERFEESLSLYTVRQTDEEVDDEFVKEKQFTKEISDESLNEESKASIVHKIIVKESRVTEECAHAEKTEFTKAETIQVTLSTLEEKEQENIKNTKVVDSSEKTFAEERELNEEEKKYYAEISVEEVGEEKMYDAEISKEGVEEEIKYDAKLSVEEVEEEKKYDAEISKEGVEEEKKYDAEISKEGVEEEIKYDAKLSEEEVMEEKKYDAEISEDEIEEKKKYVAEISEEGVEEETKYVAEISEEKVEVEKKFEPEISEEEVEEETKYVAEISEEKVEVEEKYEPEISEEEIKKETKYVAEISEDYVEEERRLYSKISEEEVEKESNLDAEISEEEVEQEINLDAEISEEEVEKEKNLNAEISEAEVEKVRNLDAEISEEEVEEERWLDAKISEIEVEKERKLCAEDEEFKEKRTAITAHEPENNLNVEVTDFLPGNEDSDDENDVYEDVKEENISEQEGDKDRVLDQQLENEIKLNQNVPGKTAISQDELVNRELDVEIEEQDSLTAALLSRYNKDDVYDDGDDDEHDDENDNDVEETDYKDDDGNNELEQKNKEISSYMITSLENITEQSCESDMGKSLELSVTDYAFDEGFSYTADIKEQEALEEHTVNDKQETFEKHELLEQETVHEIETQYTEKLEYLEKPITVLAEVGKEEFEEEDIEGEDEDRAELEHTDQEFITHKTGTAELHEEEFIGSTFQQHDIKSAESETLEFRHHSISDEAAEYFVNDDKDTSMERLKYDMIRGSSMQVLQSEFKLNEEYDDSLIAKKKVDDNDDNRDEQSETQYHSYEESVFVQKKQPVKESVPDFNDAEDLGDNFDTHSLEIDEHATETRTEVEIQDIVAEEQNVSVDNELKQLDGSFDEKVDETDFQDRKNIMNRFDHMEDRLSPQMQYHLEESMVDFDHQTVVEEKYSQAVHVSEEYSEHIEVIMDTTSSISASEEHFEQETIESVLAVDFQQTNDGYEAALSRVIVQEALQKTMEEALRISSIDAGKGKDEEHQFSSGIMGEMQELEDQQTADDHLFVDDDDDNVDDDDQYETELEKNYNLHHDLDVEEKSDINEIQATYTEDSNHQQMSEVANDQDEDFRYDDGDMFIDRVEITLEKQIPSVLETRLQETEQSVDRIEIKMEKEDSFIVEASSHVETGLYDETKQSVDKIETDKIDSDALSTSNEEIEKYVDRNEIDVEKDDIDVVETVSKEEKEQFDDSIELSLKREDSLLTETTQQEEIVHSTDRMEIQMEREIVSVIEPEIEEEIEKSIDRIEAHMEHCVDIMQLDNKDDEIENIHGQFKTLTSDEEGFDTEELMKTTLAYKTKMNQMESSIYDDDSTSGTDTQIQTSTFSETFTDRTERFIEVLNDAIRPDSTEEKLVSAETTYGVQGSLSPDVWPQSKSDGSNVNGLGGDHYHIVTPTDNLGMALKLQTMSHDESTTSYSNTFASSSIETTHFQEKSGTSYKSTRLGSSDDYGDDSNVEVLNTEHTNLDKTASTQIVSEDQMRLHQAASTEDIFSPDQELESPMQWEQDLNKLTMDADSMVSSASSDAALMFGLGRISSAGTDNNTMSGISSASGQQVDLSESPKEQFYGESPLDNDLEERENLHQAYLREHEDEMENIEETYTQNVLVLSQSEEFTFRSNEETFKGDPMTENSNEVTQFEEALVYGTSEAQDESLETLHDKSDYKEASSFEVGSDSPPTHFEDVSPRGITEGQQVIKVPLSTEFEESCVTSVLDEDQNTWNVTKETYTQGEEYSERIGENIYEEIEDKYSDLDETSDGPEVYVSSRLKIGSQFGGVIFREEHQQGTYSTQSSYSYTLNSNQEIVDTDESYRFTQHSTAFPESFDVTTEWPTTTLEEDNQTILNKSFAAQSDTQDVETQEESTEVTSGVMDVLGQFSPDMSSRRSTEPASSTQEVSVHISLQQAVEDTHKPELTSSGLEENDVMLVKLVEDTNQLDWSQKANDIKSGNSEAYILTECSESHLDTEINIRTKIEVTCLEVDNEREYGSDNLGDEYEGKDSNLEGYKDMELESDHRSHREVHGPEGNLEMKSPVEIYDNYLKNQGHENVDENVPEFGDQGKEELHSINAEFEKVENEEKHEDRTDYERNIYDEEHKIKTGIERGTYEETHTIKADPESENYEEARKLRAVLEKASFEEENENKIDFDRANYEQMHSISYGLEKENFEEGHEIRADFEQEKIEEAHKVTQDIARANIEKLHETNANFDRERYTEKIELMADFERESSEKTQESRADLEIGKYEEELDIKAAIERESHKEEYDIRVHIESENCEEVYERKADLEIKIYEEKHKIDADHEQEIYEEAHEIKGEHEKETIYEALKMKTDLARGTHEKELDIKADIERESYEKDHDFKADLENGSYGETHKISSGLERGSYEESQEISADLMKGNYEESCEISADLVRGSHEESHEINADIARGKYNELHEVGADLAKGSYEESHEIRADLVRGSYEESHEVNADLVRGSHDESHEISADLARGTYDESHEISTDLARRSFKESHEIKADLEKGSFEEEQKIRDELERGHYEKTHEISEDLDKTSYDESCETRADLGKRIYEKTHKISADFDRNSYEEEQEIKSNFNRKSYKETSETRDDHRAKSYEEMHETRTNIVNESSHDVHEFGGTLLQTCHEQHTGTQFELEGESHEEKSSKALISYQIEESKQQFTEPLSTPNQQANQFPEPFVQNQKLFTSQKGLSVEAFYNNDKDMDDDTESGKDETKQDQLYEKSTKSCVFSFSPTYAIETNDRESYMISEELSKNVAFFHASDDNRIQSMSQSSKEDETDISTNQRMFTFSSNYAIDTLGYDVPSNEQLHESREKDELSSQILNQQKLSSDAETLSLNNSDSGDATLASTPPVEKRVTFQSLGELNIKTEHSVEDLKALSSSSSCELTLEPTLLAASYDLDSGYFSRIVTAFDISPDTVEKQGPIEVTGKSLLSSPDDDVFEIDSLLPQKILESSESKKVQDEASSTNMLTQFKDIEETEEIFTNEKIDIKNFEDSRSDIVLKVENEIADITKSDVKDKENSTKNDAELPLLRNTALQAERCDTFENRYVEPDVEDVILPSSMPTVEAKPDIQQPNDDTDNGYPIVEQPLVPVITNITHAQIQMEPKCINEFNDNISHEHTFLKTSELVADMSVGVVDDFEKLQESDKNIELVGTNDYEEQKEDDNDLKLEETDNLRRQLVEDEYLTLEEDSFEKEQAEIYIMEKSNYFGKQLENNENLDPEAENDFIKRREESSVLVLEKQIYDAEEELFKLEGSQEEVYHDNVTGDEDNAYVEDQYTSSETESKEDLDSYGKSYPSSSSFVEDGSSDLPSDLVVTSVSTADGTRDNYMDGHYKPLLIQTTAAPMTTSFITEDSPHDESSGSEHVIENKAITIVDTILEDVKVKVSSLTTTPEDLTEEELLRGFQLKVGVAINTITDKEQTVPEGRVSDDSEEDILNHNEATNASELFNKKQIHSESSDDSLTQHLLREMPVSDLYGLSESTNFFSQDKDNRFTNKEVNIVHVDKNEKDKKISYGFFVQKSDETVQEDDSLFCLSENITEPSIVKVREEKHLSVSSFVDQSLGSLLSSQIESERGSDFTFIESGNQSFTDSQMMETDDSAEPMLSPEDHCDSSSVDSFATVVAVEAKDYDDVQLEKSRQAEIASMASSFASEVQISFEEYRDDTEEDTENEQEESEDEQDNTDDEQGNEQNETEEEDVLAEKSEEELTSTPEDKEKESDTSNSDRYEYVDNVALSVITEMSDEDKFERNERDLESEAGLSDHFESSPDINFQQSPGVYSFRFFGKSAERDDVSVSSSLAEFEKLEKSIPFSSSLSSSEKGVERFCFGGSYDERKLAEYSKLTEGEEICSIASSLAEFEHLEQALVASSSSGSVEKRQTPEGKGSGGSGENTCSSVASSLTDFEKYELECQTGSLEKRSLRSGASSGASLKDLGKQDREYILTAALEEEAMKIVSILESGVLMECGEFEASCLSEGEEGEEKDSLEGDNHNGIDHDSLSDGAKHDGDADSLDEEFSEMTDMISSVIFNGSDLTSKAKPPADIDVDSLQGEAVMQLSTDSLILDEKLKNLDVVKCDSDSLNSQDDQIAQSSDIIEIREHSSSEESAGSNEKKYNLGIDPMQTSSDSLETDYFKDDTEKVNLHQDNTLMKVANEQSTKRKKSSEEIKHSVTHSQNVSCEMTKVSIESDRTKSKPSPQRKRIVTGHKQTSELAVKKDSKVVHYFDHQRQFQERMNAQQKSSGASQQPPVSEQTFSSKLEPFRFSEYEDPGKDPNPFLPWGPYQETKKVYTMVEWEEMKQAKKEKQLIEESTSVMPFSGYSTHQVSEAHARESSQSQLDSSSSQQTSSTSSFSFNTTLATTTSYDRDVIGEYEARSSIPDDQHTGAESYSSLHSDDDVLTHRLVMKKEIHKRTLIGSSGQDETSVFEDSQVQQDNEPPEELRDSMQVIIDQFMEMPPHALQFHGKETFEEEV